MSDAVYEVVIDHNSPDHHAVMEKAARDLKAWSRHFPTTKVTREEQEIRPGVFRFRFLAPTAKGPAQIPTNDKAALKQGGKRSDKGLR